MSILNTSASNLIKTCCRCHQHLPATSEYFNKNKTHCRNCARAYRAAWYLAHSDKVKARHYDPLFDVGNIRPATHIENMYNRGKQRGAYSSLFKGVSWDKKAHQWRARIRFKGKQVYLGGFNTELEASFAYQEAATKYHREFACVEGHQ